MEREAKLQDELVDLIQEVSRERRFHGVEITRVERDLSVDGGKADIVVFTRGDVPFLIVETKRKAGRGTLFDPLEASAVGQVMSYAFFWKRSHPEHEIPFVATANPEHIAVFRIPKNIEEYIDRTALLKRDYRGAIKQRYFSMLEEQMVGRPLRLPHPLTREFVEYLLDRLAEEYAEKKVTKPEPSEAMVERFRAFVRTVAEGCEPLVEAKLREDRSFREEVERLGYKTGPEALPQTAGNLARMMAYVLLNKIIFRKILEKSYRIPPMNLLDSSSRVRFVEGLKYNFDKAVEVTKDFEPIFRTGVYDQIPLPEDPDLLEYINDLLYDLESVDLIKIGEKIGYMYEVLIPPEERHQLGQFYTPPWVCELITRWCIRSSEDVVLDPGVGSGGFLLQAYRRLLEKKIGPGGTSVVHPDVHEKILSQLYALDINPFPAHLSAMAISIKSITVPSTKLNVLVSDFFAIQPGQKVLSPYKVKTVVREEEREIVLPKFDAVVGNPPYTRWIEIPKETQKLIRQRMGKLIKEYGLTPRVARGLQPGIYTYWIMHANSFLKEGGRLGMIISDTWLQTTYGIGFGNFLVDHFRIKAVVDFGTKLFKEALVTTCIVLAEKESDETKRLENKVAFIYVPPEKVKSPDQVKSKDVEELIEAVETGSSKEYIVMLVKQKDLPRDRKWINMFFKLVDISSHPLIAKLGDFFEPSGGNTVYSLLTSAKTEQVRGPGASEFLYLSPSKIKEYGLDKWSYPNASLKDALVYPAITSVRQANFFTFTKEDWEEMRKSDDRCYMFVCHRPREELPKEVADYIRWGETECRTMVRGTRKGGRLASETEGATIRAREKKRFHDWYDLGGVVPAPIFATYQAWYKTRFTLCRFPVAMYHALIALVPKQNISLDEIKTRALLAFLNSSFAQAYIETEGRKSPGGIIGFEINMARKMPILDVRKLNDKQLSSLARLFDELEREARKIGGASTREQIERLKPKIYEIDRAVAEILSMKKEDVKNVEAQVDLMIERRISAARKV